MSVLILGRAALIALFGAAGVCNLYWTIQRRSSPAEFKGCLLAGAALLLLAGSLVAQAARQNGLAWLSGGLGTICGAPMVLPHIRTIAPQYHDVVIDACKIQRSTYSIIPSFA